MAHTFRPFVGQPGGQVFAFFALKDPYYRSDCFKESSPKVRLRIDTFVSDPQYQLYAQNLPFADVIDDPLRCIPKNCSHKGMQRASAISRVLEVPFIEQDIPYGNMVDSTRMSIFPCTKFLTNVFMSIGNYISIHILRKLRKKGPQWREAPRMKPISRDRPSTNSLVECGLLLPELWLEVGALLETACSGNHINGRLQNTCILSTSTTGASSIKRLGYY